MIHLADFTNTVLQGLLVLGFWIVCWLLPAAILLLLLDSTVGKRLRRQETSIIF